MIIQILSPDKLSWAGKTYSCATGKGGFIVDKKEGDGATPIGLFLLRRVFYRADRITPISTELPVQIIKRTDGWCDDVKDDQYNKHIKLPRRCSYENLWREDGLYDVVIEVGYNDEPCIVGCGSAIFMHVAKQGYLKTEGCIALAKEDLLEIIKTAGTDTYIKTVI